MALGELFDKQLSPALTNIYWEALRPYPFEAVREASNHVVRNKKFHKFPLPAEFIEFIVPPQALDDSAALACNGAIKKAWKDGYWENAYFEDPIIHMVIADYYGGWFSFVDQIPTDDKERGFWKKEFERIYKVYARRPLPSEIPLLPGYFATQNAESGYLTDALGQPVKSETDGYVRLGTPEAQKLIESGATRKGLPDFWQERLQITENRPEEKE